MMGDVHVRSLLICNLPPQLLYSRSLIRHHFSKYSTVVQVVLNAQQENCLIVFESCEDAEKAKTHGSVYKNIPLNILWADPAQFDPRAADSVAKYDEAMDWLEEDENWFGVDKRKDSVTTKQEKAKDIKIGQMMLKHLKASSVKKSDVTPVKLKQLSAPFVESDSNVNEIKEKTKRSLIRKVEKVSKTKKTVKKDEMPKREVKSNIIEDPLFFLKTCTSVQDKLAVLKDRDRLMRKNCGKDANIETAVTVIGICPDMCPERERLMREYKRLVHVYEMSANNGEISHELAVKEYSRSSADQEEPLPHDLRSESVLTMTMVYLINNIMNKVEDANENLADWYDFCWNRLRSIRKDIIQQQLCALPTVNIVEQCARFHICCFDRLWGCDATVFDVKINTENLMNCLQTLIHMYEDLAKQDLTCPNEAEFLAYTILLKLNSGDILWEFQQFSQTLRTSMPIQFAIKAHAAFHNNMYSKFFSLVKDTNYLNACILQQFFASVRSTALRAIVRAYCPPGKHGSIPADEIMFALKFDTLQDTVTFCKEHGILLQTNCTEFLLSRKAFVISQSKVIMPSSVLVRNKRFSVPQAVVGESNEVPVYVQHDVHSSFDSNGKLNVSALDASDQGKKCRQLFNVPDVSVETLSRNRPSINLGRTSTNFKLSENNKPINNQTSPSIIPTIDLTIEESIDGSIDAKGSEMIIYEPMKTSQDKDSFTVVDVAHVISSEDFANSNKIVLKSDVFISMDEEPFKYIEEKSETPLFDSKESSTVSNNMSQVSKPVLGGFTFTGSSNQTKNNVQSTFIENLNAWKEKINRSSKQLFVPLRPEWPEETEIQQFDESIKILADEVDSSCEKEIPSLSVPTIQPATPFCIKTLSQINSTTLQIKNEAPVAQHLIPTSSPKTVELEKVMEAFQREQDNLRNQEVAEKIRLDNAKRILVDNRKKKMEEAEVMRILKKDLRKRLKIVSNCRLLARLWQQKVQRIKQRRLDFPVLVHLSVEEHISQWGTIKNKFPKNYSIVQRMKQTRSASKVVSRILELGIEGSMIYIGDIVAETLIKQTVEEGQKRGIVVNIAPVYWKVVFCIPDDVDNESTFGTKFSRWCRFAFYGGVSEKLGSVKKIMTSFNIPVYLCVHLIQGTCNALLNETICEGLDALLWVDVIAPRKSREIRVSNLKMKKQYHPIPLVIMRIGPSYEDPEIERKADELKQKGLVSASLHMQWNGLPSVLQGLSFLSKNRHCSWSLCVEPLANVVKRVSEEFFDAIAKCVPISQRLSALVRDPNNVIQLFNICLRELTHILLNTKSENTPTFAPEFRPLIIEANVSCASSLQSDRKANVSYLTRISLPHISDWPPATSYHLLTTLKRYCAILNCPQLLPTIFRTIDPPDDDEDFIDHLQAVSWISIIELYAIHTVDTAEQSSRHLVALYDSEDVRHIVKSQWWLDSSIIDSIMCVV